MNSYELISVYLVQDKNRAIKYIPKGIYKRKCSDEMEQFEDVRKKALQLFQQGKYLIADHTLERMIEREIFYEDIESVLSRGSFYSQELDKWGDIRYGMRGGDSDNKRIRITFIVRDELIVVTVIREQE